MRFWFRSFFFSLFIVSFLCCCSGPKAIETEERDHTWATSIKADGLPNLFRVSDDLYRSGQPQEQGMTSAKNLGIKSVISLRATELDRDLNRNENAGLSLRHVPITTWHVTDNDIISALKAIHELPKPVLIHCRHGSDRTGMITAFYRILYQGWSKEEAIRELKEGGYGYHAIFTNIPDEIRDANIESIRKTIGL